MAIKMIDLRKRVFLKNNMILALALETLNRINVFQRIFVMRIAGLYFLIDYLIICL